MRINHRIHRSTGRWCIDMLTLRQRCERLERQVERLEKEARVRQAVIEKHALQRRVMRELRK